MTTHRTAVSTLVVAPPADVYRACLDPELLVKWRVPDDMSAQIQQIDARPGGRLSMSLTYVAPGRSGKSGGGTDRFESIFVAMTKDREIVEAVNFHSDDPAFAGTMIVTTLFEPVEGGTRVYLTCDHIPPGIDPADNEEGTRQSLAKLANLFA